ncbi:MAG: CatB-related O-acetyltransferase [Thermodesulfovibrionales bacterium]|nr:CatB-related O-acetyltransferase [Thermodesulfovibrionales bacterium]
MDEDYLKKNNIFIHPNSIIATRLSIGYGSRINGKIIIKGDAGCIIGKYCAIGSDVKVITSNHAMNTANIQRALEKRIGLDTMEISKGDVVIGNNVWIGDSAIILSGVNIGDGSIIGAGAVVTRIVEPFAIVAGSPAKKMRMRFKDNIIKQLMNIAWWNWTEERIKRNINFFKLDLTLVPDEVNLKEYIVE